MKKLLALVLAFTAFAAHAEWELVTDGNSGGRLLFDRSTVEVKTNKKNVLVAVGDFRLIQGKGPVDIHVVVRFNECPKFQGDIILGYPDNSLDELYYSGDGKRLYDYAGVVLCAQAMAQYKKPMGSKSL